MRVKDDFNLEDLIIYGFEDGDDETTPLPFSTLLIGDDPEFEGMYFVEVAGGRRGQDYYLLVDKDTRYISIYATHPDGQGASGFLDDTIIDMLNDGIIERG